jgi:membrane-associated phospholipid phosphatase
MAVAAGGFALLAALCLFWLDPLIASATAGGARDTFWDIGTALLDLLVLKEVDNFFPGALLILAALVALAVRSTRRSFGWPLLYVALVQFLSTVAADLSKPPFGRLRPFEAAARDVPDAWFVGANSFPSGHAAFYAGLFFPLMILFPRGAPLLAVPPLFIAIARVAEHDHYASDVAASLAFAAGLSAALAFLVRRAPPESASPSP